MRASETVLQAAAQVPGAVVPDRAQMATTRADHATPADEQDFAGTPRPDAMLPVLDEDQLEALRQVGREWDQVSAAPRVWRQALPVDPALGEYPKASEFRPARFTWLVPVAGRDGDLPPIETTSAAETPLRPGIVFVIEGVTKFTSGAWVAIVLIGLIILGALRIRRYYDLAGQQLALRPEEAARAAPGGRRPGSPRPKPGGTTTSTPARRCTSGSAPPSSPATTSAPSSTTSPPRRWTAPGPSPTSCTAA